MDTVRIINMITQPRRHISWTIHRWPASVGFLTRDTRKNECGGILCLLTVLQVTENMNEAA